VRHRLVGLAISIGFACGGGSDEAPPAAAAQAPAAEQSARFGGFRFTATLEKHTPAGTELATLAEVSLPHAATMKAIVAAHRMDREPPLQIEVWTFEQRTEDELAPVGDPATLIRLEGRLPDPPDVEALRRELAAPTAVVGRARGLDVESATLALERLHAQAKIVSDIAAAPRKRVDALAEMVRGLEDEQWLSQERMPWLLDLLAQGPWVIVGQPDGTAHRMRMRAKPGEGKPEYSLAFLKKPDGWVLQQFEQRR
jgi:hypothetical protein